VDAAAAQRNQGIGLLFDGASPDDQHIALSLATGELTYSLMFDLASGRIDGRPGEDLIGNAHARAFVRRYLGADDVVLLNDDDVMVSGHRLRDPNKLAINLYLDLYPNDVVERFDRLLKSIWLYHSRSLDLRRIRTLGSASAPGTLLQPDGENLWSALRNLRDRGRDRRYRTIIGYMAEAFPTFEEISFEQTGAASIYAQFYEKRRRNPIPADAVADGHLQLLLMLTALFGAEPGAPTVIMLDEPELSLHPWALAVLAKAVKEAAAKPWHRQILIATHSPVLISQFQPQEIFASEPADGQTRLRQVSELDGIGDLLDQYAAGSLYMAEQLPTVPDEERTLLVLRHRQGRAAQAAVRGQEGQACWHRGCRVEAADPR
jgi:hypothetical protein